MKVFYFLVLISCSLMASSLEKVTDLLPKDVKQLSLHKTSPKDAEKILGKANLIEGKKYYWEREGFKYSIQLIFDDKNKLSSLLYTFSGKKPSYQVPDEKKLIQNGKYFRYEENGMVLNVDPVRNTLSSVKIQ